MAKSKTMVGSRAKVYVNNVLVGLFDSCSYSFNVSAEPIHILGKFAPDEITPTAAEAVTVDCSGFRIIGQGSYVLPKMPRLQDLLNLEKVTIAVVDRQTGETILTAIGCVPVRHSGAYQAKATSKISISYMGTKMMEEDGDQDEQDAASLP
jgi:hypothetical protein